MVKGSACPDATSLERLVQGLVPESDASPMEEHLEHCAHCTQVLSGMQSKDLLIQRLQEGRSVAEELSQDSVVEELIRSVDGLRLSARDTQSATKSGPNGSNLSLSAILAPPEAEGEIGRLGRFRILKVIGEGGMGAVLAAEDPKLGRTVALKVVQPARAQDASSRNRFLREARAAAAVTHDNIVTVYEVGEDRGILYLVMPLLPGESLQARLQRQGALPPEEVARLGRQIADGLTAAHARGLIHRDIKPTNIWLEETPVGSRAKILDFGLARLTQDEAGMTSEGVILGTPAYIAPEQARGLPIDARADLFSLGCVLYQAATGRLPWAGADTISAMLARFMETPKTPAQVNPGVPATMSEIIMWLLAREASNRPQSAAALAQALGSLDGAQSTEVLAKLRPTRRRRRWVWFVLIALVLLALPIVFQGTLRRWLHREPAVPGVPDRPTFIPPRNYPRVKLDDLQRDKIDPYELRIAGRGDPANAPAELVAILGDSRFNDCAPLTFNHEGTQLITTGDGVIRAWDTLKGQELRNRSIPASRGEISPDGKLLALGLGDGTIKVLDAATWTETVKLKQPHTYGVWSLAISQDSRFLAANTTGNGGDQQPSVKVWDLKTGSNLLSVNINANAVGFRDGGKMLVVGSDPLTVYDVATGKQLQRFPNTPSFEWPSFSPDGALFLATTPDKHSLVDTTTGKARIEMQGRPEGCPRGGVFSPDGRWVAIAGRENVVRVWDVATGKLLHTFTSHAKSSWYSVIALAFSRDGKLLASAGSDGTRIWDLSTGKERFPRPAHAGPVATVAFNPRGPILASGGVDNTIRMWNLSSLKSDNPDPSHAAPITHVMFSPDGYLLVSASLDHTIQVRHVLGLWRLYRPRDTGGTVNTVAFSPDGETLVAACGDHRDHIALFMDSISQEPRGELKHRWPAHGIAFSPDGRTLAVSGYANEIQLWSLTKAGKGWLQAERAGSLSGGSRIAFTPDGKSLVAARPNVIQIFDLEQKKEPRRLPGGPDELGGTTINISPDGRWLAVPGGRDGKLWLWDLDESKPEARTIALGSGVNGGSFSPDSRHIALGHDNGTISILRLAPANAPEDTH
jgi:WD40 repeat protein/serine/threonine protein kinase